jgi:hypothetical protein
MDTGGGARAPVSLMLRTFVIAIPGLTLPFVIRAAVIDGVATATEVSTVGVVYTALLGLVVYRQFDWRRIYPLLVDTLSLTGEYTTYALQGRPVADRLRHRFRRERQGGRRDHRGRIRDPGTAGGPLPRSRPAAVSGGEGDGRARGALSPVIILAMAPGRLRRRSVWGSTARARSGGCRRMTRLADGCPGGLAVALAIVVAFLWLSIGFL